MKKNINKFLSLIVVFIAIFLASCVNDTESVFQDNGSSGIVELFNVPARNSSTPAAFKSTAFDALDVVELPIVVNYTGINGAPEDIAIHLSLDSTLITLYNDSVKTEYSNLPSKLYSVAGYDVVIPKGKKQATLTIKIYPPRFSVSDFTTPYALGVKIETASHGIISGNYSKAVFGIGIKNKYDGVYNVTGTFVDYANAAFAAGYPKTIYLKTQDPTSVGYYDFSQLDDYGYYFLNGTSGTYFGSFAPVFTFDKTSNKITSVVNYYGQPASNGRSAELDPSGINSFDPETRTIQVSYWMNQPTVITPHRSHIVEVFTYVEAIP